MDKNRKAITESNRSAWNEAMAYHQRARNNSLQVGFGNQEFTTLNRDCDKVLLEKIENINLAGKVIAQMPCNNGRELLSLMRFGAQEAIGFDISDVAINEAKQLAEISKLNARFERVNILEIDDEYDSYFDFIYVSEGSLQWFPVLDEFFTVISRLLKPEGTILIFEMHPFAYFFETGFDPERQNFEDMTSYFDKGPYGYKEGLDYVGETKYEAKECYWFMHTFSDIINAILKSGIAIHEIDEHNLEMANNRSVEFLDKFPLSYMLVGKRELDLLHCYTFNALKIIPKTVFCIP